MDLILTVTTKRFANCLITTAPPGTIMGNSLQGQHRQFMSRKLSELAELNWNGFNGPLNSLGQMTASNFSGSTAFILKLKASV